MCINIEDFDAKEELAADYYSFQGELVACLCVLSVIIINLIWIYLIWYQLDLQVWIYFTTWKKRKSSLLSCQVNFWNKYIDGNVITNDEFTE